jgi:homoserine dehydrogenase
MRHLRLSLVGFGTVGRWLARAVHRRRSWLNAECDVDLSIVSVATRREGFVHCEGGFDLAVLLDHAAGGRPLMDCPGARRWETALAGLGETGSDILAEASNTDPRESEPALSYIRLALERGMDVITSSKGPCAAAAVDLLAMARQRGIQFRMESTVMSGTPVLSTIREGLAGARVVAMRGILNGTANYVLTRMTEGLDYAAALASAQAEGYAEPDPGDDLEGHDVVAKTRILAAVAFGQTITLDQVIRVGISGTTSDSVQQAVRKGCRLKFIAVVRRSTLNEGLGPAAMPVEVRVEPLVVSLADPLSRIDGVMNALTIETDTVRNITIVGPGAGPEQAGQGMFADLVSVLRQRNTWRS